MRRYKFIGPNYGYFWDVKPVTGNEYSENELRKMYDSAWPEIDRILRKNDWQEVFEDETGWISVNDRLPENDNEVLAYIGQEIVQCYLKNGIWKGSVCVTDNMNDGYVNDRTISKQGDRFDIVTHWMPLPKPPVK